MAKWIDNFVMETSSGLGRNHWLCLMGAGIAALALKGFLLARDSFPFNSDEAVVALMARHILQGERPIFFYGQAYMGSLDAFLVAAGFLIFGDQVWVVRVVQAMLYLGTLFTTFLLGRVIFSDNRVGLVAAWLLAIPAINVTLYTTVSLGGYGEMLLIGNLILLCALALGGNPWRTGMRYQAFSLAIGLLIGLGLWAFGLTLVFSLPALAYVAWQTWEQRNTVRSKEAGGLIVKRASLILLGIVTGSAPWWGYARSAGLHSLLSELGGSAIAGVEGTGWTAQVVQHALNLVLFGWTVIAGVRPPWSVQWLAWPVLPLALAVWLGALAYSARNLFTRTNPGVWLLAGVCLTLVTGFVLTPFGADPSGRYFLPLAVIMALFIAWAVVDWRRRWGAWVYGLVGVILLFNLWGTWQLAGQNPPGISTQIDITTQADRRYDAELIQFLLENGENHGYSTYWVAYPLAFLSDEQLIFQPRLPYHLDFRHTTRDDRYAPYGELVSRSARVAYITVRHPALNAHLRGSLSRLGIRFQEAEIGDYHIFYDLSQPARPEELGL